MLFRIFPFALTLSLLSSCDNTANNKNSIVGYWQLTKGLRNRTETPTLQGVYYQFGADGKMQTNLPIGAEQPTDYTVQEDKIEQKSPQPINYHIQLLTDSILVLTTELRGIPFEFHLQRILNPPATPPSLYQESDDSTSR
ncbi:MAG: lipocalin family protein [Saprospiraceae bacterium]|nr:lipocalin family protein [Saprospiraceae bacterium]